MRKFILYFCVILSMFSLVACNKENVSSGINVSVGESTKFTKEEINEAVDCVKENFNFPDSTLTDLWYDENKSNSFIDGYLEAGNGSVNGVDAKNAIVLLSNFDVGDSGENTVLNPNSSYTNYKWILIRDGKEKDWKIDDSGY